MTKLRILLSQNKDAIWESWRERVFSSYPEKARRFFRGTRDPFDNPVGQTISEGTRGIIDALLQEQTDEELSKLVAQHLEKIIKIRSIQDFSASEAIAFVFQLKDVIRKSLASELKDARVAKELQTFEDRELVTLALRSFDIYVTCREQLYNVRVSELKRSVASLMRRFRDPDLSSEQEESEPN